MTQDGGLTPADNPPVLPAESVDQADFAAKQQAFYAAMLQAWVDTRMELDRTIVALSAGGIGLLASLLAAAGVQRTWHLFLYAASFIGFAVALFLALTVFKLNSKYIEERIGVRKGTTDLKQWDRAAFASFLFGAIALMFVGGVSAWSKLQEASMSEDSKNRPISRPLPVDSLKKSLDGIQNLHPTPPVVPKPDASTPPVAPPQAPQQSIPKK